MTYLTRRSVLRSSVGLAAAGTLARPYIANAAGTTAEVWWVQGFVPEEDEIFKKMVADYEKLSGNKLDYVSDTTGALQKRLAAGEKADVVVVTAAGLDAMQKENRIVPASAHPVSAPALIAARRKPYQRTSARRYVVA